MRNMRLLALAAGAALSILATAAAEAAVVAGFDTTALRRDDDFASDALDLGFQANFFGTTYAQTYVSNNGYVTFGTPNSAFTPVGLGANYAGAQPIIAAFYADVDTRGAASSPVAYGTGTFDGRAAFGATWNGVGYYNRHDDTLNSFQILLVDRADTGAGNFDIVFNYDQVQWETGDYNGGSNGRGGASASVGYNAAQGNADGTYYEFAGSRTNGALIDGGANALATGGNAGVAGRYLFNVRNGAVTTPPPVSDVPEPASWAMMVGGFGLVGGSLRARRRPTGTVIA